MNNLRSFLEFVSNHARFDLDWAEANQLTKYYIFLKDHVKKVNDNVMELRAMREDKPEQT